mmetsp:Transcript_35617/g.94252  ORF Transcript_35617/g.94252 Transcript_35617/m.94252 type:complete len:479 (-) Transcript_35617:124-1560(-)|eukprot:CAMPEP_0115668336 /NCGR_PEP_ID=MMETSP0272-20121206/50413_1 /TAXON_ID=71861 /ORGANISM="Scrippsiella trochoidea, Strain CCMP3099" /LENGTH=478 /DNA_ID=CAMNT_0003106931 /DNA_START=61 /DNA_END=1497 /DNA_ORIENTATION=+
MRLSRLPACRPEDVGLDSASLKRHSDAISRQIEMGYMPGVAECVLKENRVAYIDVQGYQDREQQVQMTDRSLHRCFSMTKPITGAGLMALWEDGKLSLDDPVSKYIPAFKKMKVMKDSTVAMPGPRGGGSEDARREITLRHLVTHTSGLGYGPGRMDKREKLVVRNSATQEMYLDFVKRVDGGLIPNLEVFCAELAQLPLRFHPGECYKYSFGMDVIGRVLEIVSGMPLDRFLRTRILEPMGMRDTTFFLTPDQARRRLTGFYVAKPCSKDRVSKLPNSFSMKRRDGQRPETSAWVAGRTASVLAGGGIMGSFAGGLVSSLRDQALFCNAIVNLGYALTTGRRVLQEGTVRAMCKNWLRLKSVTTEKCLDGWYNDPSCERLGWCPLGFCEGSSLFMGGVGSWSINLRSKTVVISLANSWCEHDIHGWDDKVDELEGAVKCAEKSFKMGRQHDSGSKRGHRGEASGSLKGGQAKRRRKA